MSGHQKNNLKKMILISPAALNRLLSSKKTHDDKNKSTGKVESKEKTLAKINEWIRKKRELDIASIMNRRKSKGAWNNAQKKRLQDADYSRVNTSDQSNLPDTAEQDSFMSETSLDDSRYMTGLSSLPSNNVSDSMFENDSINLLLQENEILNNDGNELKSLSDTESRQLVPVSNTPDASSTPLPLKDKRINSLLRSVLENSNSSLSPVTPRRSIFDTPQYVDDQPLVRKLPTLDLPGLPANILFTQSPTHNNQRALVPYTPKSTSYHNQTQHENFIHDIAQSPMLQRAIEYYNQNLPNPKSPLQPYVNSNTRLTPLQQRILQKKYDSTIKRRGLLNDALNQSASPVSSRVKRRENRAQTQRYGFTNWQSVNEPTKPTNGAKKKDKNKKK